MKNKGFTLIEMLVVIAVIGILSATVLTALGPARSKAKDTRIISALNQARTIAETLYSGTTGQYPANIADFSNSSLTSTKKEITDNGGSNIGGSLGTINSVANAKYELHATLNDSTTIYCIDSSGFAGTVSPVGSGSCK